jgi:hypothetical protein
VLDGSHMAIINRRRKKKKKKMSTEKLSFRFVDRKLRKFLLKALLPFLYKAGGLSDAESEA